MIKSLIVIKIKEPAEEQLQIKIAENKVKIITDRQTHCICDISSKELTSLFSKLIPEIVS